MVFAAFFLLFFGVVDVVIIVFVVFAVIVVGGAGAPPHPINEVFSLLASQPPCLSSIRAYCTQAGTRRAHGRLAQVPRLARVLESPQAC